MERVGQVRPSLQWVSQPGGFGWSAEQERWLLILSAPDGEKEEVNSVTAGTGRGSSLFLHALKGTRVAAGEWEGAAHLLSGDVSAASVTARGESDRGGESSAGCAALLSGLGTGSVAKENGLGSQNAVAAVPGLCWRRGQLPRGRAALEKPVMRRNPPGAWSGLVAQFLVLS